MVLAAVAANTAEVDRLIAAGADATRADARGEDALALARIRAERGLRANVGGTPYVGEANDSPDAGKRILELVSEHGAR